MASGAAALAALARLGAAARGVETRAAAVPQPQPPSLARRASSPAAAAAPRSAGPAAPFAAAPPAATRRAAVVARAATAPRMVGLPASPSSLAGLGLSTDLDTSMDLSELDTRAVREVSYVSRRRMDSADFDPDEVDEDG